MEWNLISLALLILLIIGASVSLALVRHWTQARIGSEGVTDLGSLLSLSWPPGGLSGDGQQEIRIRLW